MKKEMSKEQIDFQECLNANTSPTNNEQFDRDGYLVLKNICDPKELYCVPPTNKGQYHYYRKIEKFSYQPVETQVNGSTSRYYYPPYKNIHSDVRLKIEKEIGKKLINTYYYDRFYNPGQELTNHIDRPACEISVTIHIGSNMNSSWPIWIKTPDIYDDPIKKTKIIKKGENRSVILKPGDGMIYKGCERPHWREKMPGFKRNIIRKWLKMEELYYHQVFFHYVLSDGNRVQFAFDRGN